MQIQRAVVVCINREPQARERIKDGIFTQSHRPLPLRLKKNSCACIRLLVSTQDSPRGSGRRERVPSPSHLVFHHPSISSPWLLRWQQPAAAFGHRSGAAWVAEHSTAQDRGVCVCLQRGSASGGTKEGEEGTVREKEGETGCMEEDKWRKEIISRQRVSTLLQIQPAL